METQLHVVIPVPPPEEEPGSSGSGDAAHLTAGTAGAAALSAGARGGACAGVAILRLSVHRRGPGGMHVVLESVQADPPYLLENRTPFPLRYRQVEAVCCCLRIAAGATDWAVLWLEAADGGACECWSEACNRQLSRGPAV